MERLSLLWFHVLSLLSHNKLDYLLLKLISVGFFDLQTILPNTWRFLTKINNGDLLLYSIGIELLRRSKHWGKQLVQTPLPHRLIN